MTSHVLSLDNTPARLDRNDASDRPWVVVALSGDLDIAATRPLVELDSVVADNPGSRVLVDLTNVAQAHRTGHRPARHRRPERDQRARPAPQRHLSRLSHGESRRYMAACGGPVRLFAHFPWDTR